ncbi:MAG: ABC transporter permease subunit [Pseudorhodoplanes sp.]
MPTLLLLVLVFFFPVCELLWLSFVDNKGAFTLVGFQRAWNSPLYWRVMLITLEMSAWTVFISCLGAYPLAYLLSKARGSKAQFLFILVLVPFWTSFLVRSFAWMILLGQRGPINNLLIASGYTDTPLTLLFTPMAVIVSMSHAMMPLAVLTMLAVMKTIDPALGMAAQTMGARGGEAFWRIYFPLSLPGLAAAGLLVLVSAIGFFIAPAMLGGPRQTMITQLLISAVTDLLNWQLAGVISIFILFVAGIIFFIYDRLLGLSSLSGESSRVSTDGASSSGLIRKFGLAVANAAGRLSSLPGELLDKLGVRTQSIAGSGDAILWFVCVALIMFLVLPSLIVLPVAFNSAELTSFPPDGFSLRWFKEYYESPLWLSATYRSLIVGVLSGILATILGGAAAYVLVFSNIYGRALVLLVLLMPMIIPRMIFAVGLFRIYSEVGLVGTLTGLTIGHTIIALPYVMITMLAVFKTYDVRLDQAAWTLGANRWQSLRFIMAPQVYDGLIASFLFAFVTSFDDLTVSLFVSGGIVPTLPRQMWSAIFLEVKPILASVSTVILILVTSFVLLGEMLRRRATR